MAPLKKPKTYGRSNTSLVNNSVDAFNVLFAKNMTKRLLMKKKKNIFIKELPRRHKCESMLNDDSLQVSTEDTFDKLKKKSIKQHKVPIVSMYSDSNSESEVNENNSSVRITRQTQRLLLSSTASLSRTIEKTDSINQTHLIRLQQPSVEKIEESLEIEKIQTKPNFSMSYITVPKEPNISMETSNLGISANEFIRNLHQEVKAHCSTPIVSLKKRKMVNQTISPIKVNTLLKQTFQDINKWDKEFPLEHQSDVSKNICFSSFLDGFSDDPQQSSIFKNATQNSYIQEYLNNKTPPKRESFITLRRRKVLKSSYKNNIIKSNSARKSLTVSLESFSNFEIKNLTRNQLYNLKDSLRSHSSLVNLTSSRKMFNRIEWTKCNSHNKINEETDGSLSTYETVSDPKIHKELVIRLPKLQYFSSLESDFEDFYSSHVENHTNSERISRTISVRKNISRDIFEHFYVRNINTIESKDDFSDTNKEFNKNNECKVKVTRAHSEGNLFENFYKNNLHLMHYQQYCTLERTEECKEMRERSIINIENKVNLSNGHSKEVCGNFYKSNLRQTKSEDLNVDKKKLANAQLEDTFERFYKTNLDISHTRNSCTNVKGKEIIKDLEVHLTNLSDAKLEDTFEKFYKSNLNIRHSEDFHLNEEEKSANKKHLMVNLTTLPIAYTKEDSLDKINITDHHETCNEDNVDNFTKIYRIEDICRTNNVNATNRKLKVNLLRHNTQDLTNIKKCIKHVTADEENEDVMVNNISPNQHLEMFPRVGEQANFTTNIEKVCELSESDVIESSVLDIFPLKESKINNKTKRKSIDYKADENSSKQSYESASNIFQKSSVQIVHVTADIDNYSQPVKQDTSLENLKEGCNHSTNQQLKGSKWNSAKKHLNNRKKKSVKVSKQTAFTSANPEEISNNSYGDTIESSKKSISGKLSDMKSGSFNEENTISRCITRSLKVKPKIVVVLESSCDSSSINESNGEPEILPAKNLKSLTDFNVKENNNREVFNISIDSNSDCVIVDHTPQSKSKQSRSKVPESTSNSFLKNNTSCTASVGVDKDVFKVPKCNKSPNSVCLKAGKSWRRSLSIHKRSSLFHGFHREDSSIFNAKKICPKGKLSRLTSQSTANRLSVRFVPIKPLQVLQDKYQDTTVLEDYAANTSYVPDQILEASLEDTFRCLSLKPKQRLTSVKSQLSVPVTAKEIVLRTCSQTEPIPFSQCFPESILQNCQKIGEGVYGEVFLFKNPKGGTSVLKIVPVEGNQIVNGERQKKFEEVLSEIIITIQLSNLRNNQRNGITAFTEVQKILCVQGRYPEKLIDLWDLFDETRGSENDCPDIFGDEQLYIVFQMAYGGKDLESFVFNGAMQAYSMFKQVAFALAIAEKELKFEHRDLHWGNVLITTVEANKIASINLDNKNYHIPTMGVEIAIIDYTLSRIEHDGVVIFNDLGLDPDLFTADGDYQFEIYRLMQQKNGNSWKEFEPFTNLLWLDYILDKALMGLRYKNIKTKRHREYLRKLKDLKEDILSYHNVNDFVIANLLDV